MNTTGLRIVVDTNVMLAIIGKKSPFRWIFDGVLNGNFILILTEQISLEYREIMEQKNGSEMAENFYAFLKVHPFVDWVNASYRFNLITEDPDDNKFVDCAIAGNALCLVSNDRHFDILKLIDFPKVTCLTLIQFEEKYKK